MRVWSGRPGECGIGLPLNPSLFFSRSLGLCTALPFLSSCVACACGRRATTMTHAVLPHFVLPPLPLHPHHRCLSLCAHLGVHSRVHVGYCWRGSRFAVLTGWQFGEIL